MSAHVTVTITILSQHLDKIKSLENECHFTMWDDHCNYDDCGVLLTSLTYYDVDYGNMDEFEGLLSKHKIPYNYDVDRHSEFDSCETYFRINKEGEGKYYVFNGNEKDFIEINKVIEAYTHGAMRALIDSIYEEKVVPSWEEQLNILAHL